MTFSLAIFLLALPLAAAADPCTATTPKTMPCTADADKKSEIMREISAGLQEQQAMADAKESAKSGAASKRLSDLQEELLHKHWMEDHFNTAIQLTIKYYHLTPEMAGSWLTASPKGVGANAGFDWAKNVPVTWAPSFYGEKEIYLKMRGSDGKDHYIGESNFEGLGGETLPNGRTIIGPEIFQSALDDKNPGVLAYLIHHESRHFMELVHRGWDDFDEGEIRTYVDSIKAAPIFELDAHCADGTGMCWVAEFKEKIAGSRSTLKSLQEQGKLSEPIFPSTEKENFYRDELETYKTKEQEILDRIEELKPQAAAEQEHEKNKSLANVLVKIAAKACGNPNSIGEGDLRDLQAWQTSHTALNPVTGEGKRPAVDAGNPDFFLTPTQLQFLQGTGDCGMGLYRRMLERKAADRESITADWIRAAVIGRDGFPPSAGTAVDYDGYWSVIRAVAINACTDVALPSNTVSTIWALQREALRGVDYREISSSDQGLSGCAAGLYDEIASNIRHDNYNEEHVSPETIINNIWFDVRAFKDPPPVTRQPGNIPPPAPGRQNPKPGSNCDPNGGIPVCDQPGKKH